MLDATVEGFLNTEENTGDTATRLGITGILLV